MALVRAVRALSRARRGVETSGELSLVKLARSCHDAASLATPTSSEKIVSDEDRYWFDTNGFLILRNVFSRTDVEVRAMAVSVDFFARASSGGTVDRTRERRGRVEDAFGARAGPGRDVDARDDGRCGHGTDGGRGFVRAGDECGDR